MGFPDRLWEWYGQDEFKRVLAICEVLPALGFLAEPAEVQNDTAPYCPGCETWSEMMLPVQEALDVIGNAMPKDVRAALETVWTLCNDLSEDAFHCGNEHIFIHEEWQSVREAAAQALDLLGATELAPYLDELTRDCRNTIMGRKPS